MKKGCGVIPVLLLAIVIVSTMASASSLAILDNQAITGRSDAVLAVTTNGPAKCSYSSSHGAGRMQETAGLLHTQLLRSLKPGYYQYNVTCRDENNNPAPEKAIGFHIYGQARNASRENVLVLAYLPPDKAGTRLDFGERADLEGVRSEIVTMSTRMAESLGGKTIFGSPEGISQAEIQDLIVLPKYPPASLSGQKLQPDYDAILHKEISICDYVNNAGVSRVWLWMPGPVVSELQFLSINPLKKWTRGVDAPPQPEPLDSFRCDTAYSVLAIDYRQAVLKTDASRPVEVRQSAGPEVTNAAIVDGARIGTPGIPILLGIAAALAAGILAIFAIRKKSPSAGRQGNRKHGLEEPVDHSHRTAAYTTLENAVHRNLSQGYSAKVVKEQLLKAGWPEKMVESALNDSYRRLGLR